MVKSNSPVIYHRRRYLSMGFGLVITLFGNMVESHPIE
jgi:hypothetical protein